MTAFARLVVVVCLVASAHAQYAEERAPRFIASSEPKNSPTPVPILKQINRHNEDGSYTYGYEGADGSFKIETKSATGEVKGKYGYKDDTGKLRVIEYGANKYGFQPAGEGITVAPPTLVDESTREPNKNGRNNYRDQYYNDYDEPAATPRPASRPAQQQYRPAPQPQQYRPAPQPQYNPAPTPAPQQYQPAPTPQQYRPAPQPQQYRPPVQSAPTPPRPQFFSGAAPAPAPAQDNFFNPSPAPRQYKPKQDFRPAPDYTDFASQPAQPRFAPNQFPQQPRNTQTFSMLDQLLKEYSLPSGGSSPTHDITFGSY